MVVVNHHLRLADLALKEEGFGELLPGTDAVILDEAHQVPEIAAQYAASRAEFENTVDVTVTSAMALTEEQSAKLSQALTQRLKRTVRLVNEIDPALIGGAVVRAGDFVIDGSLRGRVERLGNIMKTVF